MYKSCDYCKKNFFDERKLNRSTKDCCSNECLQKLKGRIMLEKLKG